LECKTCLQCRQTHPWRLGYYPECSLIGIVSRYVSTDIRTQTEINGINKDQGIIQLAFHDIKFPVQAIASCIEDVSRVQSRVRLPRITGYPVNVWETVDSEFTPFLDTAKGNSRALQWEVCGDVTTLTGKKKVIDQFPSSNQGCRAPTSPTRTA